MLLRQSPLGREGGRALLSSGRGLQLGSLTLSRLSLEVRLNNPIPGLTGIPECKYYLSRHAGVPSCQ